MQNQGKIANVFIDELFGIINPEDELLDVELYELVGRDLVLYLLTLLPVSL